MRRYLRGGILSIYGNAQMCVSASVLTCVKYLGKRCLIEKIYAILYISFNKVLANFRKNVGQMVNSCTCILSISDPQNIKFCCS